MHFGAILKSENCFKKFHISDNANIHEQEMTNLNIIQEQRFQKYFNTESALLCKETIYRL